MRRILLPVLLTLGLLGPPSAGAAPITLKKSIWGPVSVNGVSQFPIYADLGVGIYQYTLPWYEVAQDKPAAPRDPADPAYRWPAAVDQAVSEASRYGMKVSLAVIGTPPWANGGQDFSYAPGSASDYADFIEAAAKRYPAVRHWMIWIEPTKANNFKPITPDKGRRLRGQGLQAPHKYAEMLDQSYLRLKGLSRQNKVIGGNTFTVGTVSPRRWIEALRLPGGRRPRMDLWGHNPFSARRPKLKAGPLGSGYADFSDLDTLVGWLDRAFKRKRLKIFMSEFALPTDHANFEFNFFLSRRTQASWLASALRITRSYKRLYTLGYLGLYDQPLREDGQQVEWGLITRDGERKPAYASYRGG